MANRSDNVAGYLSTDKMYWREWMSYTLRLIPVNEPFLPKLLVDRWEDSRWTGWGFSTVSPVTLILQGTMPALTVLYVFIINKAREAPWRNHVWISISLCVLLTRSKGHPLTLDWSHLGLTIKLGNMPLHDNFLWVFQTMHFVTLWSRVSVSKGGGGWK